MPGAPAQFRPRARVAGSRASARYARSHAGGARSLSAGAGLGHEARRPSRECSMKHISSRDNPQYKQLVRLAGGRRGDQILLEGVHVCQEWLRHRGAPEFALFDLQRLQRDAELAELAAALPSGIAVSCEPILARRLSQVQESQGVYFVAQAPQEPLPEHIAGISLWL